MKNPEGRPLRIRWLGLQVGDHTLIQALSNLAIAESNLVRAGKDSALPHFIAIVKELEKLMGFRFETLPESSEEQTSGRG